MATTYTHSQFVANPIGRHEFVVNKKHLLFEYSVTYWFSTNISSQLRTELLEYLGFKDDTSFIKSIMPDSKNVWWICYPRNYDEYLIIWSEILRIHDEKRFSGIVAKDWNGIHLQSQFYGEISVKESSVVKDYQWRYILKSEADEFLDEKWVYYPILDSNSFQIIYWVGCCRRTQPTVTIINWPWDSRETIRSLVNEENFVESRGNFFEKKYFLKSIWYYDKLLWKYIQGKKVDKIQHNSDYELASYHTDHCTVVVKAKTWGKMFFGIELERAEVVSMNSKWIKEKNDNGWRCERDGSVAAEYISPVLSLDNYEESIDFIKETAQDILDAKISHNCGWHIHVSVNGVSPTDLYLRCAPFMPLLWSIYPERASNGYSKRPPTWYDAYICRDRRDFVLKNDIGTVEFRIFPWCRGEHMLRFRLWLLNLIVRTACSSEQPMSFKEALEFIMTSEEMFDKLAYVYNTTDKMQWICKRIQFSYSSVKDSNIAQDVSKILFGSLQDFVSKKKPQLSNEMEDVVEAMGIPTPTIQEQKEF